MPTKPSKTKEYTVTVSLDKKYTGKGLTMFEALKAIPEPIKIVSKGMVKVSYGDKKLEESWMPVKIRRLFRPLSQQVMAKQLDYLLR